MCSYYFYELTKHFKSSTIIKLTRKEQTNLANKWGISKLIENTTTH